MLAGGFDMGAYHRYLNTDPFGFRECCEDTNYVDKTGLIGYVNQCVGRKGKLLLVSRPRRFGKTYAAQMLQAYYTIGYDTESLFKDRVIHRMDPELTNRGAFDVIYIDMIRVRGFARSEQAILDDKAKKEGKKPEQLDWIDYLSDSIIRELGDAYGEDVISEKSLVQTLINTVQKNGRKIVWICDEWDNFFREPTEDPNAQRNYIELIRGLFKSPQTTSVVFAAAYMTGILPMIRMKGESALTEFDNYTMFAPGELAPFIGFTEEEVRDLLVRNPKCSITYDEMADWYEGYSFLGVGPLFNPKSVTDAIKFNKCMTFWTDTGSNEQFKEMVSIRRDTLRTDVERLLRGEGVFVDTDSFDNDLRTLPAADGDGDSATLAAMVHLGYLSFDQDTDCARIPNNEIRSKFVNMLRDSTFPAIYKKIAAADQILKDTLRRDEQKIAEALREIHQQYTDPKAYNSEATLKETVDLAYYTAERFYTRMYEIPSGEGYADMVLYPKAEAAYPLMMIELKKNSAVETGMKQIRERRYPARFKDYGGRELLLVSVSYDADKLEKEHHCKIESAML